MRIVLGPLAFRPAREARRAGRRVRQEQGGKPPPGEIARADEGEPFVRPDAVIGG